MEETTTNNQNSENDSNRWSWIITGVVIVVAAVAFYAWPKSEGEVTTESPANAVAEEVADEYTASLEAVTSSDEVTDIEKDLNDTNLNDLDKAVSDVEAEVNAE
ncbi:MAG: hypothetical protein AAB725_01015 [Patescibacteria group bacterium]